MIAEGAGEGAILVELDTRTLDDRLAEQVAGQAPEPAGRRRVRA